MTDFEKFLDMGGYAAYVWPSYIVTLGLLAVLGILSHRALKAAEADLKQVEGEDDETQA